MDNALRGNLRRVSQRKQTNLPSRLLRCAFVMSEQGDRTIAMRMRHEQRDRTATAQLPALPAQVSGARDAQN
jgi:hypothetical protein